MAGYDQYVTDPAANDADRRPQACWWCRRGEHDLCENADCVCDHDDAHERAQRGQ